MLRRLLLSSSSHHAGPCQCRAAASTSFSSSSTVVIAAEALSLSLSSNINRGNNNRDGIITAATATATPHPRQCLHHNRPVQHNPSSRLQRRRFASLPPIRKIIKTTCPFRTLNIPEDAKYDRAKRAFLKIAMKHHPDTVGDACSETRRTSQEIFVNCRKALESLAECEDTGACLLKSETESSRGDDAYSDEEFDSWFREETGHQNPFQFDLDPSVMREVASMHEDMEGSHGLDRDGGMWHLASMISSAVKSGKGEGGAAESILKLEAGAAVREEDVEAEGKLGRRRKRARGRR